MYSLATVRTLFSALRSELCSIGTGVTEKVTKTFHSFLGSSSPVAAGVREPMGHHELVSLGLSGDHLG